MKTTHLILAALFPLTPFAGPLALAAEPATATEIVFEDDFEKGPWKGNAWRGEGKIAITSASPAQGAAALHVEGITDDARAQAFSKKIPVTPGATYRIDCQYRAPAGSAGLNVRWQGNKGVAYKISEATDTWTRLSDAIAKEAVSVVQYNEALGRWQGSTRLHDNRFTIPDDVTEIIIYVTAAGQNSINVDSVTLVKE